MEHQSHTYDNDVTMKAIRLERPGHYAEVEIPEAAKPGPGEALVRIRRVGICGTDVAGFLGKMPFYGYPRIPGHELGVEVLEAGGGVAHVRPGDLCAVEPYLDCGRCFACRRGRSNCCETLRCLGVHTDGGLRERMVLPARKLHPAPGLSLDQLPLVETLGIGAHAVERGDPQPRESVLVVGAGPIGLAVLQFARLREARVSILDANPRRAEFARESMGALPAGEEETFAVAFDATGSAASMGASLRRVAHSGRLVFVGITSEEVSIPDPLFHRLEATILASRNSLPGDFRRIIRLIGEGKIDTRPWVTHRAAFEDYIAKFPEFTRPEAGMIKILVDVEV
jgi:alcohol dehydrogenase